YKLNFVERNGRANHDPWSFRHVGVYHRHQAGLDLFILLHCQVASELPEKLQSVVDNMSSASKTAGSLRQNLCKQPERLHTLILSCYLDNWRSYLRYLGAKFARIAGYTLSLRNQQELHYLTREMKTHIKETGQVTLRLKNLTENTVDDSATVRIITIISAIYLPGSFVGTIFGSNFFLFDEESRRLVIAKDFWVFVAIWLGLTLATGFVYVATYMWKRLNSKARADETEENGACYRSFSAGSSKNQSGPSTPRGRGEK
ncbi:hypothetical protein N658DRAFT_428345, partial [Parathielavia hyrcaniae]